MNNMPAPFVDIGIPNMHNLILQPISHKEGDATRVGTETLSAVQTRHHVVP